LRDEEIFNVVYQIYKNELTKAYNYQNDVVDFYNKYHKGAEKTSFENMDDTFKKYYNYFLKNKLVERGLDKEIIYFTIGDKVNIQGYSYSL
jgi:hypothetical protein